MGLADSGIRWKCPWCGVEVPCGDPKCDEESARYDVEERLLDMLREDAR